MDRPRTLLAAALLLTVGTGTAQATGPKCNLGNDIITTLTGVYPDRHGVPVANSYRVFDGNNHPSSSHSSFIYWTATDATDGKPVLVNEIGKNAPAPWVAFTRAGCDFGAFSIANMEFETLPGDIGVVFGT